MEKIAFILLFLSLCVYGKSTELDLLYAQNHYSPPLKNKMDYIDYVDSGYDFLSRKVYLLSNTVDAIFTNRTINENKNNSYFRIWYEMSKSEGESLVMRPDFKIRLYLKETRKMLRFTFDNTSRAQDTQSQLSQTQATVNTKNDDKDLSASIGVDLKNTQKFRLTTSSGVRLRFPPNLFLRSTASFNDRWGSIDISMQNSFFYYTVEGFGNTSNINFLHQFSDQLKLIFETFGTWLEPRDYNAGSGFQLFYAYSDKTTLSQQIGTNANKQESKFAVKDYFISSTFRRLLYKDWFFFEVSPSILWKRENNWHAVGNIYLRLEAFFGGNN